MANRLFIFMLFHISLYSVVLAGPPFITDDPEPVEYRHWEVYFASLGNKEQDGISLTAPHCETNYGIFPNFQVHLIAPLQYTKPEEQPSQYGYGDTEIGVKFRFIQESDSHPQMGIFPTFLLPTGNSKKGLGSGELQIFLPLWLQKTWKAWKTYGGGGYWINPGTGNRNYWFFGWEAEREMSESLSLGAEVFYQTAHEVHGDRSVGSNAGAIVNFSDLHHLLLSIGKNLSGPSNTAYYISYQLTFGSENHTQ